jgi:predicted DNA-binding transcriptional regulator AlpA
MRSDPIFRHQIKSRKGSHVQPKPVLINLDQPGRLRTAHVLALCGISDSTLHARVKSGSFPPSDGKDGGRNYWNTSTILKYLRGSSVE